jgi:hypothetical protein
MPTLDLATDDSGWHTFSYKGIPVVSGYHSQFRNLAERVSPYATAYSNWKHRPIDLSGNKRTFRGAIKNKMPRAHRFRYRAKRRLAASRIQRAWRKRRTPSGTGGGKGVTQEHDRQTIYRRRRMPKRKRRRWIRFVKKVKAVDERQLGKNTVLLNSLVTRRSGTTSKQTIIGFNLYGAGAEDPYRWLGDMGEIGRRILNLNADQTWVKGESVGESTQVKFTSGVLDLTIRNVSQLDSGALDTNAVLEVDIYEIYGNRRFSYGSSTTEYAPDNWRLLFDADSNREVGIYDRVAATAGTQIEPTDRGATPFEFGTAIRQYGIKIAKKTKVYLRPGSVFTYQARDPKAHTFNLHRLNTFYNGTAANMVYGFNIPKVTKHIVFFAKLVPGITQGTGVGQTQVVLKCGVTRKYQFVVEGINDSRSMFLSHTPPDYVTT